MNAIVANHPVGIAGFLIEVLVLLVGLCYFTAALRWKNPVSTLVGAIMFIMGGMATTYMVLYAVKSGLK